MPVVIYCNRYFYYLLLQGGDDHSGKLLSSQACPTTKGHEQNTADASIATSEHQGRPEDEGYFDENKKVKAYQYQYVYACYVGCYLL